MHVYMYVWLRTYICGYKYVNVGMQLYQLKIELPIRLDLLRYSGLFTLCS